MQTPNRGALEFKATMDRVEGEWAIFVMDGGGEMQLPVSALHPTPREGSVWFLSISHAPHEQSEREHVAKTLLNQILKRGGTS